MRSVRQRNRSRVPKSYIVSSRGLRRGDTPRLTLQTVRNRTGRVGASLRPNSSRLSPRIARRGPFRHQTRATVARKGVRPGISRCGKSQLSSNLWERPKPIRQKLVWHQSNVRNILMSP